MVLLFLCYMLTSSLLLSLSLRMKRLFSGWAKEVVDFLIESTKIHLNAAAVAQQVFSLATVSLQLCRCTSPMHSRQLARLPR